MTTKKCLQQLKNEVVQAIKHNQNLSQQLNNMDIKIGLLIQNRITLHVRTKSCFIISSQFEKSNEGEIHRVSRAIEFQLNFVTGRNRSWQKLGKPRERQTFSQNTKDYYRGRPTKRLEIVNERRSQEIGGIPALVLRSAD